MAITQGLKDHLPQFTTTDAHVMRQYVKRQLVAHGEQVVSYEKDDVCDAEECVSRGATRWIYCDVCGRWLHYQCARVKLTPKGQFVCWICTNRYA